MQGTNNSRIGMSNNRRDFDDSNWGYGKKNTRGSKAKGSKTQTYQQGRQAKQKNTREYFTEE